ncbi:putative Sorting nexin-29 [Cardiosporidium cionae]|uniref:Sorting nexin-29 n=1 Tax=Cardiosporidium cionae TaxID=476202 RepID=A0ABQ7J782_9APIC|nr:putative Sorting nexin-29 [Cardiosporidium cionae]|eukprot:KAF8819853.1 putative Sorting nexin-29 [Cardiosporidium cionae]
MEATQLMARSLLDAEITDAKAITNEQRKTFMVYEIHLTAHNGEKWRKYRRYSEFFDLSKKLARMTSPPHSQYLPIIPPKKGFGTFDPPFIEQRRKDLQKYLMELLSCPPDISLHSLVCEFLQIPIHLMTYLQESVAHTQETSPITPVVSKASPSFVKKEALPSKQLFIARTIRFETESLGLTDSDKINSFLHCLQDFPKNKVAILREFDRWLFTSKTEFTEDLTVMILIGSSNNGLLFEIGGFDDSWMATAKALQILCKLSSFEFCSYANVFVRTLCTIDPIVYFKGMGLQNLLRLNVGMIRKDALNLLMILNTTLKDSLIYDVLSNDSWALREFQRWRTLKLEEENSRFLIIPSKISQTLLHEEPIISNCLSKQEYERLAEKAFTALQTLFSTFGMDAMEFLSSPTPRITSLLDKTAMPSPEISSDKQRDASIKKEEFSVEETVKKDETMQEISLPAVHTDEGHEGVTDAAPSTVSFHPEVSSIPLSPRSNEYVSLTWRKLAVPPSFEDFKVSMGYQQITPSGNSSESSYIIRGVLTLPFNSILITAALTDFRSIIKEIMEREDLTDLEQKDMQILKDAHWNTKIRYLSLLEQVNEVSQIFDCSLEASHGPHILTRLCVLKSIKYNLLDESFFIVFTSTSHPSSQQPHQSPYIGNPLFIPTQEKRVNLHASGIEIKPVSSSSSCLNFVVMLPANSILTTSAELLGESFHFWNSLNNFCSLLKLWSPLSVKYSWPILEAAFRNATMASSSERRSGSANSSPLVVAKLSSNSPENQKPIPHCTSPSPQAHCPPLELPSTF